MGSDTSARPTGKADANRKIIDAARHLFTKRGFHQAAMSDLARQADISIGQIYRSFSSKHEIIFKLVEDEIRSWEDEVRDLSRRDGFKHLSTADQLTSSLLSCVADDREAISNEIMAEAYRNPQIADAIQRFCAFLQTHLERLILTARPGVTPAQLACTRFMILYVFALRQKSIVAPGLTRQSIGKQVQHAVSEMLNDLARE